jgi:hypothetical protein
MARRAWGCARSTGRSRSVLQPQEVIPADPCHGGVSSLPAIEWSVSGPSRNAASADCRAAAAHCGRARIIPSRARNAERLALAGFLAGYSGLSREAYALDLRQCAAWCQQRHVRLLPPPQSAPASQKTTPNWLICTRGYITSLVSHAGTSCRCEKWIGVTRPFQDRLGAQRATSQDRAVEQQCDRSAPLHQIGIPNS